MNYQEFMVTPKLDEGCALFYKLPTEEKYHILAPLETIPTLQGDRDEVDYGFTTMAVNGVIKGRLNASTGTTDFYWSRELVNKFAELKDLQLDLLVVLPSWQGYKARGTVSYSYNEITRNDLVTGTLTITPSWVDEDHIDNVKDICMDTAIITTALESDITVSVAATTTSGIVYKITTDPTNATVTPTYQSKLYAASSTSDIVEATYSTGSLTIKGKATGSDIIKLTISASGVATWSKYIYVIVTE